MSHDLRTFLRGGCEGSYLLETLQEKVNGALCKGLFIANPNYLTRAERLCKLALTLESCSQV